mmetsp:Transcript_828/g.1477  ORF Transcript_828/g.1477 Transcript_828/m.1477 type:complete len:288 (+) Transcript_828:765-1628(+)
MCGRPLAVRGRGPRRGDDDGRGRQRREDRELAHAQAPAGVRGRRRPGGDAAPAVPQPHRRRGHQHRDAGPEVQEPVRPGVRDGRHDGGDDPPRVRGRLGLLRHEDLQPGQGPDHQRVAADRPGVHQRQHLRPRPDLVHQHRAHLRQERELLVRGRAGARRGLPRPHRHRVHHVLPERGGLDGAGAEGRGRGGPRAGAEPELPPRHGRAGHGAGVRHRRGLRARHLPVGARGRQDPVLREADAERHGHLRHRRGGEGGGRRRRDGHQHHPEPADRGPRRGRLAPRRQG